MSLNLVFRIYGRDLTANLIAAVYLLPVFWWGQSAFMPSDALLDVRRMVTFDYQPTLANFAVTLFGAAGSILAHGKY